MAKLQYRSLSNRVVDRLSVEGKDVIYWDRDLPGFGVRVYRSGARVYLVQGRGRGGSKRIAVGRHGVISADEARRRGAMLLTRIKAGEELEPRSGHGSRADGGRTRGKISPGACGGALQAEHGQGISPGDRRVHFAHAW